MSGSVGYQYDPNQEVYVISSCDGKPYVTNGVVIRIRADVLVTSTTLSYDIRLVNAQGTLAFAETDVFADKAAAIAEYDSRVA